MEAAFRMGRKFKREFLRYCLIPEISHSVLDRVEKT